MTTASYPSPDAWDEARLLAWFHGRRRVVVAFSGGVDSAVVLAAAARALGSDRVSAATAVSPAVSERERSQAADVARGLGVPHRWVATDELTRDGYRANDRDRCYFCKSELFEALARTLDLDRDVTVCTGTNADDIRDPFRPGIRAGREHAVCTPLAELGLTKDRIRALARRWGLPVADKPAQPCLASRIAYGVEVSAPLLAAVERAETAVRRILLLRGHHVRDLRVRRLADRVRIELDEDSFGAFPRPDARMRALFARCGFGDVVVEVAPFRSGGLNLLPVHRPGAAAVTSAQ
jgi:pyridinium-3,5-biscarboxylic acid mononucleotide sulfurtransferase